jgi:inhibitor of KinA sporulation pathway (predicted exonuclease)
MIFVISQNKRFIVPVLSHFDRDILLVPVSTVSSEATFNMVDRIIEERSSSLAPETVEAITCLKDWKRAEVRKQHQLEDPEVEQAFADFSHD